MKRINEEVGGDGEDKILKIVDRVLKGVFGEEATRLIYRYLESKHSLKQRT